MITILDKVMTKTLSLVSKINITTFPKIFFYSLEHNYKARIHAHTWLTLKTIMFWYVTNSQYIKHQNITTFVYRSIYQ